MSFLDNPTAQRDDARTAALHSVLILAYPDKVDALAIAGQVGILQADVAVHPKMRHTWWSILEEAAIEGILRRLVQSVLSDPTVGAYHADIRSVLDISVSELGVGSAAGAVSGSRAQARGFLPAIGDGAPLWPIGHILKIRFLDGVPALHARVEEAAVQWVDYANLWFDFGDYADAEIRISFEQPGSWSYVGTNCLKIPDPQPNVNFGWLTPTSLQKEIDRVVLHEFGHVIGMQHEQGNPASTIRWKKKAVYEGLGNPPTNWSRTQIDRAYFAIWPPGYYPVHKVFDPASINMLPIPDNYMEEGVEIGWNRELSPVDKQFAAALYPQRERSQS